ncbi:MAG TPA: hypothetical protein VKR83_10840 [Ktedonobacteraceae bacterium]|nr:hypothetical protein [Ktedonobacteraceae bacterium]
MYQVEDQPETLLLYVVREEAARPSLAPIIFSLLMLSLLLALGIALPSSQPVTRVSLRVPAVPLTMKSFTASVAFMPTGVKTYSATTAHGRLSIRNGSVIGQSIPAGFVVSGVATDRAVYVPGATADGDGYATVAAHVVIAGVNLPAFAVDTVIGTSLFIRNPEPFTGGQPAYSVQYVTEQDRQAATLQARRQLAGEVIGLHYPCREDRVASVHTMVVTWRCQFLTFRLPSYMHVSGARFVGKNLMVSVWFIAPMERIWVK